jgi:hypothetical protein
MKQVNNSQLNMIYHNPDLNNFLFLARQLSDKQVPLNRIDTEWINDPSSSTYLAVSHYFESNLTLNFGWRRSVYSRTLKKAELLLKGLDEEINSRID